MKGTGGLILALLATATSGAGPVPEVAKRALVSQAGDRVEPAWSAM